MLGEVLESEDERDEAFVKWHREETGDMLTKKEKEATNKDQEDDN
jgi:hypothetical protein